MTAPRWFYGILALCAVASTAALWVRATRPPVGRYELVRDLSDNRFVAFVLDRQTGRLCLATLSTQLPADTIGRLAADRKLRCGD